MTLLAVEPIEIRLETLPKPKPPEPSKAQLLAVEPIEIKLEPEPIPPIPPSKAQTLAVETISVKLEGVPTPIPPVPKPPDEEERGIGGLAVAGIAVLLLLAMTNGGQPKRGRRRPANR